MTDFGKDLIAAMQEAAAHAQGVSEVAHMHTVTVPDVRALRERLGTRPPPTRRNRQRLSVSDREAA